MMVLISLYIFLFICLLILLCIFFIRIKKSETFVHNNSYITLISPQENKDNDIKILTYCNEGYIQYTKNFINSIMKNSPNTLPYLLIICLDDESYNSLNNFIMNKNAQIDIKNYKNVLNLNNNIRELSTFDDLRWKTVTNLKLKIISMLLSEYKYICYIDSDIYVCKEMTELLLEMFKQNDNCDMYVQDDTQNKNNEIICTGLMLIKSNTKTRDLFNESIDIPSTFKNDQEYINHLVHEKNIIYQMLDRDLYPNGSHWYKHYIRLQNKAVLVHFNYVIGDRKMQKMKLYNMWNPN